MPTDSALFRAKRPRSILAGPYGHPIHGLLVTIPIGAWVASLVFDIVAFAVAEGEAYASGAKLLVAIGVIGALLAGLVGLMDLSMLESGTRARRIALLHMTLNFIVIALYVISFAVRSAVEGPSVGGMVLGIVALAVLAVSGFLGGELAYRYGVRVADEQTQRGGFETPMP